MKLSKKEWEVFMKVQEFRESLWNEYIRCIDPRGKLSIETKMRMKMDFVAGVSLAMDSLYDSMKDKECLKNLDLLGNIE